MIAGGTLMLALVASCGTTRCPQTVATSVSPARSDGVVAMASVRAAPASEIDAPSTAIDGAQFWQSSTVTDAAAAETGGRIDGVTVTNAGDEIAIRVPGDSAESAMARCMAVVRVGTTSRIVEDEATSALRAERDGALREIEGIESSLERVSPARNASSLGDDPRIVEISIRARLQQLGAAVTPPTDDAAINALPPDLALRARDVLLASVARSAEALQYGANASETQRTSSRLEATRHAYDVQRAAEQDYANQVLAALATTRNAHGAGSGIDAALQGLIAHLRGESARDEHAVTSSAPIRLRVLADDLARERVALAVMATHLGANHPERITAEYRYGRHVVEFDTARNIAIGIIDYLEQHFRGRSPVETQRILDETFRQGDSRQNELTQRRERLVAQVELLARREMELRSTARFVLVRPCEIERQR